MQKLDIGWKTKDNLLGRKHQGLERILNVIDVSLESYFIGTSQFGELAKKVRLMQMKLVLSSENTFLRKARVPNKMLQKTFLACS